MLAGDAYCQGYNDALTHGPNCCMHAGHDSVYSQGFHCGIYALNKSIPTSVHHMLQIMQAHAISNLDTCLLMTTPPLSSFSRRSIHIILDPTCKITLKIKGRKQDQKRRIEMRYDGGKPRDGGKPGDGGKSGDGRSIVLSGNVRIMQRPTEITSTPTSETNK